MPDFKDDALSGEGFETSVRQVAKNLYKSARSTGSIILDGRERDEIIDTGTELVIIEATKKRTLDKIKYDLKKSADLVRLLRKDSRFSEYNFRIILVTLNEPTADQNDHVNKSKTGCPKEVISFSSLFSRLFDARHYLRVRSDHYFGSIRNPADDRDLDVPPSSYIPTALNEEGTGENLTAQSLVDRMSKGRVHMLLGDYGSGKSMTLRDVYLKLQTAFIKGDSTRCPIYINLREHVAQTEPYEALIRHAGKIGFDDQNSLISAWRAGYLIPILDGFDELIPPQFTVSIDNLRQARRYAVELVKKFITETPNGIPILIAGRESYFDDRDEAKVALGIPKPAHIYDLAGFTDDDIRSYLKKNHDIVPSWLPNRPLLLGYLANSGLLAERSIVELSPAQGWDQLLDRVCEREVEQIWGPGFEATSLRYYLEGLASRSRGSPDSPLDQSDLRKTFHYVFGKDADEPADLLTARLPGLGSVPGRPGARDFVDETFADAAASGVLCRYIDNPYLSERLLEGAEKSLGELAREMTISHLQGEFAKLGVALSQAAATKGLEATSVDIFTLINDLALPYHYSTVEIKNGYFEEISISPNTDLSKVTFNSCIIRALELERTSASEETNNFPRFNECVIEKIFGVMSQSDLPKNIFINRTSIEEFVEFAGTNDAVIRSNLDEPVKVLITVLRKLFIQRGSGRLISALSRGIPQSSKSYVDSVIAILRSENFADIITLDRRDILMPNRSVSGRALSIINGPNVSKDSVMEAAKKL